MLIPRCNLSMNSTFLSLSICITLSMCLFVHFHPTGCLTFFSVSSAMVCFSWVSFTSLLASLRMLIAVSSSRMLPLDDERVDRIRSSNSLRFLKKKICVQTFLSILTLLSKIHNVRAFDDISNIFNSFQENEKESYVLEKRYGLILLRNY